MDQHLLIAKWLQGQIPGVFLPWQIDLDLTNICNQDCYYCNTVDFRTNVPVYQDRLKYVRLIDQLANWRSHSPNSVGTVSNVIFTGGGEPTLLPGFEQIIEQTVDSGFTPAMNTNGTKLHKILNVPADKLKRFAYLGLDIDSAIPETSEEIRRSKMKDSPFDRVKATATELGSMGVPMDIKALLMPQNTTPHEIDALVRYAKDTHARSIHFRPVVLEGKAFQVTQEILDKIQAASQRYSVPVEIAKGRYEPRQYKRCHQFFLFPSFSADGNIYLCCEYKGRPDLCIGSWEGEADWRDIWCGDRHREIYDRFNTAFCKPCRPNTTNNKIELFLNGTNRDIGFI